jgi:hypothetical protein
MILDAKDIKNLDDIRETAAIYFRMLKPHTKKEAVYTAKISVIGYADALHIAADLLKLCMLANENEGECESAVLRNKHINTNAIIELALQLLPTQEAEFLDLLHELHHQKPTA